MSSEYVYHERQEALLCGQHALNNLVQASVFTPGSLSEIAHQLDELELTYMAQNNEGGIQSKDYIRRVNEGSGNVDPQGNFSIQVLRAALQDSYGLSLPSIGQDDLDKTRDITTYPGFVCNKSSHWFAIRKIGDKFWNLNSMLEKPEAISHFRLAAELESLRNSGYSVFVVTEDLPPPDRTTGDPKFWWRLDELEGRSKHGEVATDWSTAGTGRRLDGRAPSSSTEVVLSEEEQLQRALQASILPSIPDEPPVDDPNAVTIQFRFPNGSKQARRFLKEQPVQALYAFCEIQVGGGTVELRYGFPPKSLTDWMQQSIGEAQLSGESIQVRSL